MTQAQVGLQLWNVGLQPFISTDGKTEYTVVTKKASWDASEGMLNFLSNAGIVVVPKILKAS